ncbi:unnamed protein product [Amoebophrya sp. A25]|nr:unnamed protein product [Amoebophrya sp. A25]|eukprot:GSA25T00005608001.1
MNYYDDTAGWYYAMEGSMNANEPPEGQWTNWGYSGGRAYPCPFLSRTMPFPKPTRAIEVGDRVVLKNDGPQSSSFLSEAISPRTPRNFYQYFSPRDVGEVTGIVDNSSENVDNGSRNVDLRIRNLRTGHSLWISAAAVTLIGALTPSEVLERRFRCGAVETFVAWMINQFTHFIAAGEDMDLATPRAGTAGPSGNVSLSAQERRLTFADILGDNNDATEEGDPTPQFGRRPSVDGDGNGFPTGSLDLVDIRLEQHDAMDENGGASQFEKSCVSEAMNEIDQLRRRFGWPKLSGRPRPAEGCPELVFTRPDPDAAWRARLFEDTFARIGSRSGEFWQRGFMIKFRQDVGIDWGAVTKSWANLLCGEMFHPEAGLMVSGLSPDDLSSGENLKSSGFFLPDWASRRLGRGDGLSRSLYEFMGRFLAYCLYMNCRIEAQLGSYVYACLLADGSGDTKSGDSKSRPRRAHPYALVRERTVLAGGEAAPARHGKSSASTSSSSKQPQHGEKKIVPYAAVLQNERELLNTLADDQLPGPRWNSVYDCLDDLRSLDAVKAKGLADLLEYPDADAVADVFCLDFTASYLFMGEEVPFLLCEGGDTREVTGDNREEYVRLLCKFLLKTSCYNALSSFVRGFQSVIPRHSLRMLSPKLLEGMICGQSEVRDSDWAELRGCVVVSVSSNAAVAPDRSEFLRRTFVGEWLFEVLLEMDQSQRRKLLQFWCGTTRVPTVGFKGLHPVMNVAVLTQLGQKMLPQTHVCFHKLDLPVYSSKAQLKQKLCQAIELCGNAVTLE